MRTESWARVAIMLLLLFTVPIVAEHQCQPSLLPANVDLPHVLEPALRRIYDRSPTFRRQCERVARAPHALVRVQINHAIPSRCRAFTIVRRRGYEMRAEIHLPINADLAELVAHEFEHVIEQIEGINLRKLSRVKGAGVYEVDRELFESDRAQAVGRIVAAEVSGRAAD